MIDKLDVFISGGMGDSNYRQLLNVMYVDITPTEAYTLFTTPTQVDGAMSCQPKDGGGRGTAVHRESGGVATETAGLPDGAAGRRVPRPPHARHVQSPQLLQGDGP